MEKFLNDLPAHQLLTVQPHHIYIYIYYKKRKRKKEMKFSRELKFGGKIKSLAFSLVRLICYAG